MNEAIDAIFDICGQDETQEICKLVNLRSILIQFQSEFATRVCIGFSFLFVSVLKLLSL